MLVAEAGHDLTAAERDGAEVGALVGAVSLEVQGPPSHTAPPLLPALVHQHTQVPWGWGGGGGLMKTSSSQLQRDLAAEDMTKDLGRLVSLSEAK